MLVVGLMLMVMAGLLDIMATYDFLVRVLKPKDWNGMK